MTVPFSPRVLSRIDVAVALLGLLYSMPKPSKLQRLENSKCSIMGRISPNVGKAMLRSDFHSSGVRADVSARLWGQRKRGLRVDPA